jgi:hypothetical protein
MVQMMLAVACQSSAKLTPELIVAHLTTDAEYQEMLSHKTGTNSALAASTGGKKPKEGGKKEHTATSGEEKKCFN